MRLPCRFVATAVLGVVLALVVGGGVPASAAVGVPTPTLGVIQPKITPMLPGSIITTKSIAPGVGSNYLAGLLAGSGASTGLQSVQDSGWLSMDGTTAYPHVNGTGLAIEPACSNSWQKGGDWTNSGGTLFHETHSVSPYWTQNECNGLGQYGIQAFCMPQTGDYAGQIRFAGNTPTAVPGQWTPLPNFCAGMLGGAVPAALSVTASPAVTGIKSANDGWIAWNPALKDQIAGRAKMNIEKVCKRVSDGALLTVTAAGVAGSSAVPGVACPAGSTFHSQRVFMTWDQIGGEVFSSSLSSTALASFPNCLGAGLSCALSVWLDGVECLISITACAEWWSRHAANPADAGVACKWGGYSMPAADCAPLGNCYKVPLDSISGPSSGSGCAIDPSDQADARPGPIQDNQVYRPPTASPSPTASASEGPISASPNPSGGSTTIIVPAPTVNVSVTVNVPAPTVNVTVLPPAQGPVDLPGGAAGRECYPTGQAKYNPLDWVYVPMNCALGKFLTPTPGKGDALLAAAVDKQPFKPWTDALTNLATAFTVSGGSCAGPPVALSFDLGPAGGYNKTIYPASACSEPAASLARICRAGSAAILILAACFTSAYSILMGVGYQMKRFGGAKS